jgi:O-antigen ligase
MAAPTARDRLALHVLQIGAVAVVLAAAPYKLFDLDRYFVPKELVLHVVAAIAAMLLITRRKQFTVGVTDLLLAAFLGTSFVSALFATNHWVAQRAFAISVSGAILFWVASGLRRAGMVRPLVVALALGVVVCAGTSLAQAYGVQTEYFSLNRAPGGTLGNRNFVAHLCAIGLPVVVLVALTARRGFGSLFGGVGMAVIAATLVMSRSRAAWLAVLVLAVPVGGLALLTWKRWCEPRTLRRLVVLALAAGAGAAGAIFLPNKLEWKSDNPYLESATGLVNYKEGSGRGRIVQYTNSVKMTVAHPLLGVGPGNWPVVYPKYAARNDPSMSQEDGIVSNPWPSSDWVAFLSERGVVGFTLLLFAFLGLFTRAVRDLRGETAKDVERVLTAIALIGTLVATAVVGAFDAVLLVAVPTFFVWTLAGALTPPVESGGAGWARLRELAPAALLSLAVLGVGRSGFQLGAIGVFSTSSKSAAWEQASMFDPGSYRIHMRLAQAYLSRGDCKRARPHAQAAHDLLPNAAEPRRALSACGSK